MDLDLLDLFHFLLYYFFFSINKLYTKLKVQRHMKIRKMYGYKRPTFYINVNLKIFFVVIA